MFAYPKARYRLDLLLAFGWLCTFPLPWSWSHHWCSGLTKVWSVGHHCLIVFLVCWKDWNSVFVSEASCGKFSIPHVLSFSSFCLHLLWYVIQTFLLFYIFCFPSQTSTMDDFSQDLNCMSVPFSPENSELLWHHLKSCCALVISRFDLLCISLAFPGIPSV